MIAHQIIIRPFKSSMTKIALYGATGFSGQLIAAELSRRDIPFLFLGRDATALAQVHGARNTKAIGVDNTEELVDALTGCCRDQLCGPIHPF